MKKRRLRTEENALARHICVSFFERRTSPTARLSLLPPSLLAFMAKVLKNVAVGVPAVLLLALSIIIGASSQLMLFCHCSNGDPPQNRFFFTLDLGNYTRSAVIQNLSPDDVAAGTEKFNEVLRGLRKCYKDVVLPEAYVDLKEESTDAEDWGIFNLYFLENDKEMALEDVAQAIVQIEELFESVCRKQITNHFRRFQRTGPYLRYAKLILTLAVHKAMLMRLQKPEEWERDVLFVPHFFGAVADVRDNPGRMTRLENLLKSPGAMTENTRKLAAVMESAITSNLSLLNQINIVRSQDPRYTQEVQGEMRRQPVPLFLIATRNMYPNIARLVNRAIERAQTGLMRVRKERSGQRLVVRVNETFPCHALEEGTIQWTWLDIKKQLYVPKYRLPRSEQEIENPSPWSKTLARLFPQDDLDGRLANRIEAVRPDCYKSKKEALRNYSEEELVVVSVKWLNDFKKLVNEVQEQLEKDASEVDETSAEAIENRIDQVRQAYDKRPLNVNIPSKWLTDLRKLNFYKFLKKLGLAILKLTGILTVFFLSICVLGFIASAGTSGFLVCAAATPILAGVGVVTISPGLAAGFVGLEALRSTSLWLYSVHHSLSTVLGRSRQLFPITMGTRVDKVQLAPQHDLDQLDSSSENKGVEEEVPIQQQEE